MRDLTREEITEYLEYARQTDSDFHREQAQLIGDTVTAVRLLDLMEPHFVEALEAGFRAKDIILSIWVWAFQMGRECESRLLTLALKGHKRKEV